MKPKVPIYDAVNIELSGYDYPILESFQKFINSIAKSIDVSVDDCWGLPNRDVQISTYKPQSEIINFQYHLKMYRRVLQVTDISSQQVHVCLFCSLHILSIHIGNEFRLISKIFFINIK